VLQAHDDVPQGTAAAAAAVAAAVAPKPAAAAGQLGDVAGTSADWHAAGDELLMDDAAGWQQHDSWGADDQELQGRQQQQQQVRLCQLCPGSLLSKLGSGM
jgi:hypothetical protein